ncbi:MAG: hypothetical protein LC642_05090 [Verrucomicrobiaceae bacterium]|nr:hypothetical protein [Verrucomicrobiaceae bacterium]
MDEPSTQSIPARRSWLKRVSLALGIFVLVLLVFHRPVLQSLGRRLAIHFAAKENLKLELRVEGSILGEVILRNIRVVATGPSAVQSADVDYVRVDYSLFGFLSGGMPRLLQDVEVRNAHVVLDPAKAPETEKVVEEQKTTLPAFFPDRATLANINVRMEAQPQDLLIEQLFLELHPQRPGELRIAKLQLPSGRSWSSITAQTSYENRNLFLRDLVLDDQTKLKVVNLDASKVDAKKLDVAVEGTFAGAQINGTVALGEKEQSLDTRVDLLLENTSLEAVAKYPEPTKLEDGRIQQPEVEAVPEAPGVHGNVRRMAINLTGQLDRPNSWNGSVNGVIEKNSGVSRRRFNCARWFPICVRSRPGCRSQLPGPPRSTVRSAFGMRPFTPTSQPWPVRWISGKERCSAPWSDCVPRSGCLRLCRMRRTSGERRFHRPTTQTWRAISRWKLPSFASANTRWMRSMPIYAPRRRTSSSSS